MSYHLSMTLVPSEPGHLFGLEVVPPAALGLTLVDFTHAEELVFSVGAEAMRFGCTSFVSL